MKTGDIIVRDDYAYGMRFSNELGCFVWCKRDDGSFLGDSCDVDGYKRVAITKDVLLADNWYLTPKQTAEAKQKQEIVDEVIRNLVAELNLAYIKVSSKLSSGQANYSFINGLEYATKIVSNYSKDNNSYDKERSA